MNVISHTVYDRMEIFCPIYNECHDGVVKDKLADGMLTVDYDDD